ncbi:MAG: glycosyltransferase family 2 protein [Verrucomicrobia bacterium]|nr:glycosyltransferase family 2 protein [Verrucomicrobiota bacterium]
MTISLKIITYNRSECLQRTLIKLSGSALRVYPIEVIDNCSSDSTPLICASFIKELPLLSYKRNHYNIGLVGNMMRAYESFTTEYCWILCDDDEYDWSGLDLLFQLIHSNTYDAIVVGAPEDSVLNLGDCGSGNELCKRGSRLYHVLSFLPAVIFRRSLLEGDVLFRCNKGASSLWAHAPLIENIILNAASIKILNNLIVRRGYNDDLRDVAISSMYEIVKSGSYMNYVSRQAFYREMLFKGNIRLNLIIKLYSRERRNGIMKFWQFAFVWCMLEMSLTSRILSTLFYFMPRSLHRFIGIILNKNNIKYKSNSTTCQRL